MTRTLAPRTLVARAPTRIDFGGGWTDVPPYTTEQGGCVCNLAIARYATVRVTTSDGATHGDDPLVGAALRRAGLEGAVSVSLESDFPRGAGLGGSSAAGVALALALSRWNGESLSATALAERSRATEVEELGIAGGFQDHYAAALGGALALHFSDHVDACRIPLDEALCRALERRCILVYSGESRISAQTITAVLDAYRDRVPRVVHALARMKQLAGEMAQALERSDVDALGALVGEHWESQRALQPGITTPRLDAIMRAARGAGALGGKALGASGGGCAIVIAPEESVEQVKQAVAAHGELLPFGIDTEGATVLEDSAHSTSR